MPEDLLTEYMRNFSVIDRECLAVIFCIEKFGVDNEGLPFTVYSNHLSLLWLNNLKNPTGNLFKFIPNRLPLNSLLYWKSLVPKCRRRGVIQSCHDNVIRAHLCFHKILEIELDTTYSLLVIGTQ